MKATRDNFFLISQKFPVAIGALTPKFYCKVAAQCCGTRSGALQ